MNRAGILVCLACATVALGAGRGVPGVQSGPKDGQAAAVPGERALAQQSLALQGLRLIAGRSGVALGIEVAPFGETSPATAAGPANVVMLPVVTAGAPRAAAAPARPVDEFLAQNPGYESVSRGGVVGLRPVGAGADPANWLNAEVPAFDVKGGTVADALFELGRLFDPSYQPSRVVDPVPSLMPSAAAPAEVRAGWTALEAARSRRISIHLTDSTVRGVLDAIVAAHGEASWIVSFNGTTPSRSSSRIDVVLWSGPTITAFPDAAPRRATQPRLLVPLPPNRNALRTLPMRLGSGAMPVMGMELGPECVVATAEGGQFALDLTGLDTAEALALFLAHCGGYELRDVQGVLNIGPRGSFERSVLNAGVRIFALKDVPLCDALTEIQRALDPAFTPPREPASARMRQRAQEGRPGPGIDELLKPVTAELRKATLRDVFNAIVTSHGSAAWVVEQREGRLALTVQTRGASTTVTLGPPR